MESLLAAAPFHVVAFSSVSSPSAHSPSVLRSIRGGGRAVRCAAAKVRRVLFPDSKWDRVLFVLQKNLHSSVSQEAILYALEHDEMFNSEEVIQWESGKTINSIAAAQGIDPHPPPVPPPVPLGGLRRRQGCAPQYPRADRVGQGGGGVAGTEISTCRYTDIHARCISRLH